MREARPLLASAMCAVLRDWWKGKSEKESEGEGGKDDELGRRRLMEAAAAAPLLWKIRGIAGGAEEGD